MKFRVDESYPGELQLPGDELRERLEAGCAEVLRQLGHDPLMKGWPGHSQPARGGEMRIVGDLSDMMVNAYVKRLARLQEDVQRLLSVR